MLLQGTCVLFVFFCFFLCVKKMAKKAKKNNIKGNNICTYIMDTVKKS